MATPSRSASIALVGPFPVRPREVPHTEIEGLVASLLDLCSGCESAVRTVISMQRNLGRVRKCRDVSPEAALQLETVRGACE